VANQEGRNYFFSKECATSAALARRFCKNVVVREGSQLLANGIETRRRSSATAVKLPDGPTILVGARDLTVKREGGDIILIRFISMFGEINPFC